jgi:hypothetical protein
MYVDPIIDNKEKEMKKGRNIDWNEYKKINT